MNIWGRERLPSPHSKVWREPSPCSPKSPPLHVTMYVCMDARACIFKSPAFTCVGQITWKKATEVHPLTIGMYAFAPDSRISVDFNQRMSEWSLIIQDVGPMDEGIYQCQISTKNELDTYDILLNVKSQSVFLQ